MHRSRLILGALLLVSICLVAAPAAAVAQRAFTFFGGPATLSPFVRGQVGALVAP